MLLTQTYVGQVGALESSNVSRSLAAGQGFSNPYSCVTGATAHLAPVYPYLVSLVYRAFPPGNSRELARYIFSATIASLIYALLPWLAVKLRLKPGVGMLAGLVGAAVPLFFWVEVISEWEQPLLTLLLLVALGLFADLFGSIGLRPAIAAGVAWGAAILTAPTVLPVFIGALVAWLWHWRRSLPLLRRPIAALFVPMILLILPWTIRNYVTFHEFIPIRGSAGMQLSMSFNPLARATFDEDATHGAFVNYPYISVRVCQKFAKWGEVAMNQRYQQEAVEWIRANPGRTARLIAERFVAFWEMSVPSRIKTAASWLLAVLALLGLGLCLRQRALAGTLTGLVLLMYPLAYYLNTYETRYRYPLHPFMLLLACVFLSDVQRRISGKAPEPGGERSGVADAM